LNTPPGPKGFVSVHRTVPFGVAVPLIVKSCTPVVPLVGETDPVRLTTGGLTFSVTLDALLVTEPFRPCNVIDFV
jgi:hypothetical protein